MLFTLGGEALRQRRGEVTNAVGAVCEHRAADMYARLFFYKFGTEITVSKADQILGYQMIFGQG